MTPLSIGDFNKLPVMKCNDWEGDFFWKSNDGLLSELLTQFSPSANCVSSSYRSLAIDIVEPKNGYLNKFIVVGNDYKSMSKATGKPVARLVGNYLLLRFQKKIQIKHIRDPQGFDDWVLRAAKVGETENHTQYEYVSDGKVHGIYTFCVLPKGIYRFYYSESKGSYSDNDRSGWMGAFGRD